MDYVEYAVVLDRSGSMQSARADHEGGINSFIREQAEQPGEARFTLIQFDSEAPCEIVTDGVPIKDAPPCKLVPRGSTPLLDAIGKAVAHLQKRIDGLTQKPDQTVILIVTDGQENASREWTKEKVRDLITEREAAGWRFIFLGANVDAFAEAGAIGMQAATTMDFANTPAGVRSSYDSVTSNTLRSRAAYRSGDMAASASAYNFSAEQRAEAMETEVPDAVETATTGKRKPEDVKASSDFAKLRK